MRRLWGWLVFIGLVAGVAAGALGQSEFENPRPVPRDWVALLADEGVIVTQQLEFFNATPRLIIYRDGRIVWRDRLVRDEGNPWRVGRVGSERLAPVLALARRNGFFNTPFAARSLRNAPGCMTGDVVGLADGARSRAINIYSLSHSGPQPIADVLTRASTEVAGAIEALVPAESAVYEPSTIRVGLFRGHRVPSDAPAWPVVELPRLPGQYGYGESYYAGKQARLVREQLTRDANVRVGNELYRAYWSPAVGTPPEDERMVRVSSSMPQPAPASPPAARVLPGHRDAVVSVAWSPYGTYLATGAPTENGLHIWNLKTGRQEVKFSTPIERLAWRPQGGVLAMWTKSCAYLFEAPWETHWKTGRVAGGFFGFNSAELDWHPDGDRIATSAADIEIWDIRQQTGRRIQGKSSDCRAKWHPDGKRLAIASTTGDVEILHVPTGQSRLLRQAIGADHVGIYYPVAWRPDGKWLAAPGVMDGTVRIWETETGRELHKLEGNGPTVNSIAWSPDGRWLAATSGDRILLWAPAHGKQQVLKAGLEVYSVCWSPDGKQLAVGCSDGAARIWNSPVASGFTAKAQRSAEGRKEGKK